MCEKEKRGRKRGEIEGKGKREIEGERGKERERECGGRETVTVWQECSAQPTQCKHDTLTVCVCVCKRERKRERESIGRGSVSHFFAWARPESHSQSLYLLNSYNRRTVELDGKKGDCEWGEERSGEERERAPPMVLWLIGSVFMTQKSLSAKSRRHQKQGMKGSVIAMVTRPDVNISTVAGRPLFGVCLERRSQQYDPYEVRVATYNYVICTQLQIWYRVTLNWMEKFTHRWMAQKSGPQNLKKLIIFGIKQMKSAFYVIKFLLF